MFSTNKLIIGAALLASTAGVARVQAHGEHAAKGKGKGKGKATTQSVCPMSHEKFTPSKANSVQFEGKTVFVCCPGCKAEFAALSPAQKKAKLAEAQKLAAKAKKSA